MSRFSVNIANLVLTNEQYRKLKIYAEAHDISIHEAIQLLIDSLPEYPQTRKRISKHYPFIFSRRLLQAFLSVGIK